LRQLRKLGRHRGVAARELLDRQVVGLVVGQAQVVGGLVQRFLGFLQVLDGFVNALGLRVVGWAAFESAR